MNYNTWGPKKYIPKTNNNEDKISPVEEPQIVDTHSDVNTENINLEANAQNIPPSTIVLTEDNIEKTDDDSSWPPGYNSTDLKKSGPKFRDVLIGFALFIGLQVVVGIVGIFYIIATQSDLTNLNDTQLSKNISDTFSSTGFFVVSSLILGWIGLLFGVWLAGRRTEGGWKTVVSWKFKWIPDILIALGFTLGVRVLEMGVGKILEGAGYDPKDLSNEGILTSLTGGWKYAILFGAAICAPIVEELFFRGLFLSVTIKKLGIPAGIIITSLVFGLLHAQGTLAATIYTVTSTALIGAGLALLFIKTKRLGTPVMSHIFLNSSAVLLVLFLPA